MKTQCYQANPSIIVAMVSVALLTLSPQITPLNAADAGVKKKATLAIPSVVAVTEGIPNATFDSTTGHDPFFPASSRNRPVVSANNITNNSPPSIVAFTLKGVTSPPKRTALVNNTTFEVGESGDVKLPDGAKVRVRCLEIRDDLVVIEAGEPPQRIELRLRLGL